MNKASKNQSAPLPGDVSILPLVLSDLQARSDMGKKKYGTRLYSNNGRSSLWDAYQEALDLVMYLRQAIAENEIQPVNSADKRKVCEWCDDSGEIPVPYEGWTKCPHCR